MLLRPTIIFIIFFVSTIGYSQTSEIIKLDEKNSYQYKNYYEDGSLESIIGFYAKKPISSIELFEEKLKKYKIKLHGEEKTFYSNGQLKEITIYRKGKVIEYMKQYFDDGEEYAVPTDKIPEFQFNIQEQNIWFNERVKEIESKYKIILEGKGVIALEIRKNGIIKSIKVRAPKKELEKYLLEIGEQIEVKKSAMKDHENIGTRFAFRIEL